MIRNILILVVIVSLISCSSMTISDTKRLPKEFQYDQQAYPVIVFPVQPAKIHYCNYTNSFVILEQTKNILYRVEKNGKISQRIGEFGFDEGQFVHISDFSVDSFGNIFVVDDVLNVIVQFDDFGQYVNSFSPTEITEPELITVQDTGELLIYDSSSNQVFCYTKQNSIRFKFGKFELNDPQKITSSLDVGYIEDAGNNSIFMIDSFGGLLDEISTSHTLIDIAATKSFYYFIDATTGLYVARRTSSESYLLGNVAASISGIKPSAIVAFGTLIGVLEGNKLYTLQLIGN